MDTALIYKTAAELGIQQWERDGLIALVGPLSRGDLHLDMFDNRMCVGGRVASRKGCDPADYVGYGNYRGSHSLALHPLYYPDCGRAWGTSSPQAARAILNFLILGEPRWHDVMAVSSVYVPGTNTPSIGRVIAQAAVHAAQAAALAIVAVIFIADLQVLSWLR